MKNKMFVFWIMFNFWWSAEWSEQITLTEAQKNEKSPLSHWKIKCLFLDYIQLLMIGWVIWAKNVDQNAKKWKRPPKSSKNKMFIFGLFSTSDDRPSDLSKKRWPKCKKIKNRVPKSSKNKMSVFGLRSTSEDRPSNLSKKHWPKRKKWKRPPKSSKNKMFVFGLRSTSDDEPSNLSKNCQPKCKKMEKPP